MFERLKNVFRKKENNVMLGDMNMTATDLILARQRAEERGMFEAETPIVGMEIGAARRRRKLTLDKLAEELSVGREDVIDLELGLVYPSTIAQKSEELQNILGFSKQQLDSLLLKTNRRH